MTRRNSRRNTVGDRSKPLSIDSSMPHRWASFAILLTGAFLSPLNFFTVNAALPQIRIDLASTSSELQLVVAVYIAAYATLLVTGGRLGDIYGRRTVFLSGSAAFGLASLICGLAPSSTALVVGRILQGASAAMIVPQGLASIHVLFQQHEKSRALAIYGTMIGLAVGVGQALGGVIASMNIFDLGWRVLFFLNVPVIGGILVCGAILREAHEKNFVKLDWVGAFLCAVWMATLIIPIIEGREHGWPAWSLTMLGVSPIVGFVFLRHEARVAREGATPLIDPAIFLAPGLRYGILALLFFYVTSVFFPTFSIYLQVGLTESPASAGIGFVPFAFGLVLGPPASSCFMHALGRAAAPVAILIEAIGFLIVAILASCHVQALGMAVPVFLAAWGQGMALPLVLRALMDRIDLRYGGLAAGAINATLQIGAAISLAAIGSLFYSLQNGHSEPASVALAFASSTLCIVACLLASALFTGLMIARSAEVLLREPQS